MDLDELLTKLENLILPIYGSIKAKNIFESLGFEYKSNTFHINKYKFIITRNIDHFYIQDNDSKDIIPLKYFLLLNYSEEEVILILQRTILLWS